MRSASARSSFELRGDLGQQPQAADCRPAAAGNCAARAACGLLGRLAAPAAATETVNRTSSAPRTRGLPISAVTAHRCTTAAARCRNSLQARHDAGSHGGLEGGAGVGAGGGRELAMAQLRSDICRASSSSSLACVARIDLALDQSARHRRPPARRTRAAAHRGRARSRCLGLGLRRGHDARTFGLRARAWRSRRSR